MIVVRLRGGLGNQLFEYACGRALALRNGAPLKLDVTRYRDRSYAEPRPYLLDRFRITASEAGAASSQRVSSGCSGITARAPVLRFVFSGTTSILPPRRAVLSSVRQSDSRMPV